MEDEKRNRQSGILKNEGFDDMNNQIPSERVAEKLSRKRSERFTYLVAAVMSTFGITSMAVMAVYYRFSWQMEVRSLPLCLFLSLSLRIIYVCELCALNWFFVLYRVGRCLFLKCLAHLLSLLVLQ